MVYTAQEVDELNSKFERAAQRQMANRDSVVKLRAAERDLLQVAELARDKLVEAVKGDKGLLAEIFGGTCVRFHRFRRVLDTVELSEMHANDQRWRHLAEQMDIIEEVLKELGLYKPWQPRSKQPENLVYKGLRARYSPGEKVVLRPDCDGGEVANFTVEPPLPDGLHLDGTTGQISGILPPSVEFPSQTYTVTATNESGEAKCPLTFQVAPEKPLSVAYPALPAEIFTGESVSFEPEVTGGTPREWSIKPALPEGLVFNASRGVISGAPRVDAGATQYTVTGSNSGGAAVATFTLAVRIAPPVSLRYPEAQDEYPFGTVVYLIPEVTLQTRETQKLSASRKAWSLVRAKLLKRLHLAHMPRMEFSIEPALPEGIILTRKTGIITGKPASPTDVAAYTVTVRNDGGSTTAALQFAVRLTAPKGLEYKGMEKVYFTGQPISLSPQVDGLVSEWDVVPALPSGLHLDPAMGILTGVPTEVAPEGTWTVTARNSEGSSRSALTFAIQKAPPSNLEYPGQAEAYAVLKAVALHPTIAGGKVDEFTVSPGLPPGMSLEPSTGVISGTPTSVVEETSYEVTARNETGTSKTVVKFAIKVMPPEALRYPQMDDLYTVGEAVLLEPQVQGGATSWTVEPELPPDLKLDASSGAISGKFSDPVPETSYVITASNEAGGTSVVITFAVTEPTPEGLSYPESATEYVVGSDVLLEPTLQVGTCVSFEVEPQLPEGLALDGATGVISGSPVEETPEETYKITGRSKSAGSTSVELTFACPGPILEDSGVNQRFAAIVEEVTDIAEMPEEPAKGKVLGDWMVWMVHRAWLNDPTLTDFNFNNLAMPLPHYEPRIAPKLMKAMAHNTHITSLQLSQSNLQKPQGYELAESLRKNTTLQFLNIETNNLDSNSIKSIAEAISDNTNSGLEVWRFNNQKHIEQYFGRPVEQAIGEMMEKNMRICKLGFACNDPHWRLTIDRAILRNNDFARRRRKGAEEKDFTEIAAKDKIANTVTLSAHPEKAVWEVFEDDDKKATLIRRYMVDHGRLPTQQELQAYARGQGTPLKYSEVAPLVKGFRTKLLDAAVGLQITVLDECLAEFSGWLRAWTEKNDRWSLDVWPSSEERFNFTADKQPMIGISEAFKAWLRPSAETPTNGGVI